MMKIESKGKKIRSAIALSRTASPKLIATVDGGWLYRAVFPYVWSVQPIALYAVEKFEK